jgi:hypothetical protein
MRVSIGLYFKGSGFIGIGVMPYVSVGYDWFDVCVMALPSMGKGVEDPNSRDPQDNRSASSSVVAVFLKFRIWTF